MSGPGPTRGGAGPRERRLATVDLGSNTVRLLVVDADGTGWRVVHQAQQVTRLGEGQARSGRLGDEAMARTARAMASFAGMARDLGATEVRAVATSAVREARNGADFRAVVRAATGLDLEVISGETEARIALAGASAGLPDLAGACVLVDIGGGSTELIRAEPGQQMTVASLRLGVVALAERFVGAGPLCWERFGAMRRDVDRRLAAELPAGLRADPAPALVGTAGTVTTLAALDLGLDRYDADRVQGHRLGRPAVERVLGRLAPLSVAEREGLACVEAGRGDLLMAGVAVCLGVLDWARREAFLVSDRGLREGIVEHVLRTPVGGVPGFPAR